MAKIDVKATVQAPPEVFVKLIRADHAASSSVFRVCFEVFLSLSGTFLGFVLGSKDAMSIHYWVLIFCFGAAAVFLWLSFRAQKDAASTAS